MYTNQTKLSKKNTKIGLTVGAITGLLIGLTIGTTVFTISGGSPSFAIGLVVTFTGAFAAGGTFMGILFDLDARERNAGETIAPRSKPVARKQLKLQPIAKYLL